MNPTLLAVPINPDLILENFAASVRKLCTNAFVFYLRQIAIFETSYSLQSPPPRENGVGEFFAFQHV